MIKQIEIPYGNGKKILNVDEDFLIWIKDLNDASTLKNPEESIREALRKPIGTSPLSDLVRQHGKETIILADDSTRSTPQHLILPVLLDELNHAGVPDSAVTVLIALGTHRPMTEEECRVRFGEKVMSRVRVENLPQNPDDFVDFGSTPVGTPVQVSRKYVETPLSIAVGSIVPHMYAGWTGGAKMIQPGVSSAITTASTHLSGSSQIDTILGHAENPVRKEMEKMAIQTGLKFILNVVLNRHKQIVDVVAGDVVLAHRQGVKTAQSIYMMEYDEEPNILIASSHPADRDLWQGFKPLINYGREMKEGTTLILLVPAPEGITRDHPQFVEMGMTPAKKILEQVHNHRIADPVAAATYMAFDRVRRRIHIHLVTDGITAKEAGRVGMSATTDFDEAFAQALNRHGKNAKVGVIKHGEGILKKAE
ncbi:nickel-dependent lactate racemase [bacterium]|nr:nickel-dependent lactate racemase [bacterium]RQV92089.1 MAG: nickel-dependent lactate racemase [bacterium]